MPKQLVEAGPGGVALHRVKSQKEWSMNTKALTADSPPRKAAPLTYLLGAVFAVFIGILILCYVVTQRTNPVILDEHGKVVTPSGHDHAGH
jgi:hypothetical protein